MRVVLQRVRQATVSIDGAEHAAIGIGYLLLVGFAPDDNDSVVDWMIAKITGLRLFADGEGRMNLDLAAVGGAMMVVSQFTLLGDASKGRRPSFIDAAPPAIAIPLYEHFVAALRTTGATVATGVFGATMQVALVNDGPVTLLLERHA
ncbi:MAG: D-tyrosyl-tRNA(Tyr) deacylase [Gemmatimonadales bacterium]|nr:D-tyrosyl-tRNA(Tyr) deacylase [Gemmatimonadales bacterium]